MNNWQQLDQQRNMAQPQLQNVALPKDARGGYIQTPGTFILQDGSTDGNGNPLTIKSPQLLTPGVPLSPALPAAVMRLQPPLGSEGLTLISNAPLLIGIDPNFVQSFQVPAGVPTTVPASEQTIGVYNSLLTPAQNALVQANINDSGIYVKADPNPVIGIALSGTPSVSFWFEMAQA